MKKIIFIFFLLSNTAIFSQSSWIWQNPFPQGNDINSIKFFDSQLGYTVGEAGVILKTVNGGLNWSLCQSPVEQTLYSVSVLDSNSAIATGEGGVIIRTTNRGSNWIIINSGTSNNLYCVQFVNQSTGYICGTNIISKSTNSGLNWIVLSNESNDLYSMSFVNENTGWFCSYYQITSSAYNKIFRTTNGGANIVQQYSFSSPIGNAAKSIFFINDTTGWCIPNMKTTDGGVSWFRQGAFVGRNSFLFIDENTGWKIEAQTIYKTTNGGNEWIQYNLTFPGISLNYNFNKLFIGGSYGAFYYSSNYGSNWINISNEYFSNLKKIDYLSSNNIRSCSDSGDILYTSNSGANWISKFTGNSNRINDVNFIDENTGWIVTWDGQIKKTTDNGNNWTVKKTGNIPRCVKFFNSNTGVVGDLNVIYKTTDSGDSWQNIFVNGAGWVNEFYFLNQNTGFAAGFYLLKTTDGGNTWSVMLYNNASYFTDIYFANENTGFSCKNYDFYRTTDGGNNWTIINLGFLMYSFSFINQNTGISSTSTAGNRIYKTYNGGINWYQSAKVTNSTHNINDIKMISEDTCWIVGVGGLIMKSLNGGGITGNYNNSSETPKQFSLYQNYPNPFNPTTKIKFNVPKSFIVTLKIFDILGREIAILVNEKLNAGEYEINFDGSNLSSGIYFYKLETNSFSETKKMLLLK